MVKLQVKESGREQQDLPITCIIKLIILKKDFKNSFPSSKRIRKPCLPGAGRGAAEAAEKKKR